jgi:hypothetical protein
MVTVSFVVVLELDPGPVQGPKLPLGVTMLKSGRGRAFVTFKKKTVIIGDYHRIEHAAEARTIADDRKLNGPKMKEAGTLQNFVYREMEGRGMARCGG